MPELQPSVSHVEVVTLLEQHFEVPVLNLIEVKGSPLMRTFSFLVKNQEYLIRFNKDNMMNSNLPKEKYLSQRLTPNVIPIVPVIEVGRYHDLHFAISQPIQGQRASDLSRQDVQGYFSQLMKMLDALRGFDISDTRGYGVFDDKGQGTSPSWTAFLDLVSKEEDDLNYFGKWYHLFNDTFLERDLFEDIYHRMLGLTSYLPSERFMVHGSYTLHNILIRGGKITAVLEWLDARYGDFLYDVATLDFWHPWLDARRRFLHHYQECKVQVPFYLERILCYECYIALGALRFFAYSGNEEYYRNVRAIILSKL